MARSESWLRCEILLLNGTVYFYLHTSMLWVTANSATCFDFGHVCTPHLDTHGMHTYTRQATALAGSVHGTITQSSAGCPGFSSCVSAGWGRSTSGSIKRSPLTLSHSGKRCGAPRGIQGASSVFAWRLRDGSKGGGGGGIVY